MAAYKVRHEPGLYRTAADVTSLIDYITSPAKVQADGLWGGAVLPENAATAMNCVTDTYHKKAGPRARHSILSFSPNDPLTAHQVKEIAKKCVEYYEDKYQILSAVHEDCDHLHIHFAMNTISYIDGAKYHGTKADYYGFLNHMNKVLRPYGITAKAVKE